MNNNNEITKAVLVTMCDAKKEQKAFFLHT